MYIESQGTIQQLMVHNTLQQNRVVERMYKTIFNSVQMYLLSSQLPLWLWVYATQY